MCLAALLYEQFLPIREWRCPDIDQVLLHGDHFFLSCELLDKNASIRSKLPTAACWSREITEENLKQTCFMSKAKATSVPQLENHSQYNTVGECVGTLIFFSWGVKSLLFQGGEI